MGEPARREGGEVTDGGRGKIMDTEHSGTADDGGNVK